MVWAVKFGAQVVQASASGVLVLGALLDRPPLVLVYAGAALVAGESGFSLSIRSAMTPKLAGPGLLPSALALNQVLFHTTLIVGPAIGGVVIDQVGLELAYADRPRVVRGDDRRLSDDASAVPGAVRRRRRRAERCADRCPRVRLGARRPPSGSGGAVGGGSVGRGHRRLRPGRRDTLDRGDVPGGRRCRGRRVGGVPGDDPPDQPARLAPGEDVGDDILVVTGGPRLGDVEAGVVAAITTPATSVVLGGAMCLAGSSFSRLPCRTSCASARRAETRVAV